MLTALHPHERAHLDGLAAARARGRTGGQKAKLTPRQARIAQHMDGGRGGTERILALAAELSFCQS